jgi:flagellar capping protein FliD
MSGNNMSGEEMQNKIATARRDAEALKDKIKRRKDELADTSRKLKRRFSFLDQLKSSLSLETRLE